MSGNLCPSSGAVSSALPRIAILLVTIVACAALGLLILPDQQSRAAAGSDGDVVLLEDGGWCWFQDERAVVVDGRLIVGSVASGWKDPSQKGDVVALVYNLKGNKPAVRFALHQQFLNARGRYDDHNAPAFLPLADGRVLAVYAMHGDENRFYAGTLRISGSTIHAEESEFVPSEESRVTYSNPFLLTAENAPKGRIYNFYRGLDDSFKPSYAWSDDSGKTWESGNVFIDVPSEFRHRPYVKYVGNGKDTVHFFYTDGHPRNFDNSIYHVFYRDGTLYKSDGSPIRSLREGLRSPEEGTKVFAGNPANVAWSSDIHLDSRGNPYAVYSVQKDAAGLADAEDGMDHRYRYARWDGSQWLDSEIGFAGTRLYPKEGDYTGNIALDPHNPDQVFFSANVHPESGKPLISKKDGRQHWELFRGVTDDGGTTWRFLALTSDSGEDNLRPIVPVWQDRGRLALLWLKGEYRSYTDYRQAVMLRLLER